MSDQPTYLFKDGVHQNLLLPAHQNTEDGVEANQHVIVHDGHGLLLDPGGYKLRGEGRRLVKRLVDTFDAIVLSHQDPDVVASLSSWLVLGSHTAAYVPRVWERFVPHFGISGLVPRLRPVDDEGCWIDLQGAPIALLPAHFLHSSGNIQVYDETSKILYSGDLGASIGEKGLWADDFEAHRPSMEAFHRRYMGGRAMMAAWAKMARELEIDMIAPQHGATMRGPQVVSDFIDWIADLSCGPDLLVDMIRVPDRSRTADQTAGRTADRTASRTAKSSKAAR